MSDKKYKEPIVIVVAILALILVYGALTMKDKRDVSEKVSDAYYTLDDGVDKAARQLESRTPGEKLGDAVKDVGDTIKDNTSPLPPTKE